MIESTQLNDSHIQNDHVVDIWGSKLVQEYGMTSTGLIIGFNMVLLGKWWRTSVEEPFWNKQVYQNIKLKKQNKKKPTHIVYIYIYTYVAV